MLKTLRNVLLIVLFLVLLLVVVVNYVVVSSTKKQLYDSLALIPKNKVGVVLGTSKFRDKARTIINPFYSARINAAVALYMAGKIDVIIVSGDNSTKYYNEPLLMKNDLIARGVPADHIYMDNSGYRTLDSILRCRDVFGQNSFTIISQRFHNERAVFIANHKNVKTVAFCSEEGDEFWFEFTRERFARLRMVYDIIFNTQATYYGDKVDIP
ncbi:MAG: vancomycin high temperature exclusion protein [Chitinophagia bacterium]|nr:vancomycin high temperature exclusion protein [Chitinophagia bacterium]